MVWIENISYIIAFIISAGMAAVGIMTSFQLYHQHKKPIFSILLYQQIFLFSFLFYGIWGNMALHTIIGDLKLNEVIEGKLVFFVPIIGIPFMVVSWFMLLKFAFNLNGYKFTKGFIFGYFPTFMIVVFSLGFLIHKEIISIPINADLFVIRILAGLNLLVHIFFILPFLNPKRNTTLLIETGFIRKWALVFLAITILYTVALSYFTVFGFISMCVSIILLFSSAVFIPIVIRIKSVSSEINQNMDFTAFCKFYEISKREAEIVMEICEGLSNKAISEKLFITLQTVKDHNHRIYTKTGVKSRVQLSNLVREKTGQ